MFKLEESMSREGKLGNSYLQKLLRGLDQTFIPVEQKFFFFLLLLLKLRCLKLRVLPMKKILFAVEVNDIRCAHFNHYIFCHLSRVCGPSPFL